MNDFQKLIEDMKDMIWRIAKHCYSKKYNLELGNAWWRGHQRGVQDRESAQRDIRARAKSRLR